MNSEKPKSENVKNTLKSKCQKIKTLDVVIGIVLIIIPNIGAVIFLRAICNDMMFPERLNRPSFYPPSWLFGVVWPILYLLIGIGSFLVYLKDRTFKSIWPAFLVYFIHLFVNWSYSPVFFCAKDIFVAAVLTSVILGLIIITIILFFSVRLSAGFLLVPILTWETFATILSWSIYELNKDFSPSMNSSSGQ